MSVKAKWEASYYKASIFNRNACLIKHQFKYEQIQNLCPSHDMRISVILQYSALNEEKSAKSQAACWNSDIKITPALMSERGAFCLLIKDFWFSYLAIMHPIRGPWIESLKHFTDSLRLSERKLQLLTVCQLEGQVLGNLIRISVEGRRNALGQKRKYHQKLDFHHQWLINEDTLYRTLCFYWSTLTCSSSILLSRVLNSRSI